MEPIDDNTMLDDNRGCGDPQLSKKLNKPKKRSLVERELETNLTSRITSPIINSNDSPCSTSRYGRARRLKTDAEFYDTEKAVTKLMNSSQSDITPVKMSPVKMSPVSRMHASNSPLKSETPKKGTLLESPIKNRIESIYNENMALSRFGRESIDSTGTKMGKVYVRKDLIQGQDKDETVTLLKNMFSPIKLSKTSSSTHLNNILERSSEKYSLKNSSHQNGCVGNKSVVKTLDFDSGKKKQKEGRKELQKNTENEDRFDVEARSEYQVGDLAWARVGTYPFWPCIVTRDPFSGSFVKKKGNLKIYIFF